MKLTENIGYKINNEIKFLTLNEILYCKSSNDCTFLKTIEGKNIISNKTLKDLMKLLPEESFCRIHHSTIVNISYIKSYSKSEKAVLVLIDGSEHQVSKRKKSNLFDKITRI